ncbi:MAG TPA: hypothetical protein VJN70_15490, partial [Gemmatimonadaceae bacterium]|nr:hypothetical protein [Gemmatimonadaceae bacterium]
MADRNRPAIVRRADGALDFTDPSGTLWTVSEIARLEYSERLMAMLPHPERRQGWLLFESEHGDRRRFTPIPDDWRTFPMSGLLQCLGD